MGFIRDLINTIREVPDDEEFNRLYEQKMNGTGDDSKATKSPSKSSSYSRDSVKDIRPLDSSSSSTRAVHESSFSKSYIKEQNRQKILCMQRDESSKSYPLRTTSNGNEICILKPKEFNDAPDVCDALLSGCCVVLCLTETDIALSQRIIDFLSGSVYSLDGRLVQVQNNIFMVTPGEVDISGEFTEILETTGFDYAAVRN